MTLPTRMHLGRIYRDAAMRFWAEHPDETDSLLAFTAGAKAVRDAVLDGLIAEAEEWPDALDVTVAGEDNNYTGNGGTVVADWLRSKQDQP